MKLLKQILDLLPFNGRKLDIGKVLAILAILNHGIPGLDAQDLIQQLLTTHLDKAAIITILVGAAHKFLKAQFPEVK